MNISCPALQARKGGGLASFSRRAQSFACWSKFSNPIAGASMIRVVVPSAIYPIAVWLTLRLLCQSRRAPDLA